MKIQQWSIDKQSSTAVLAAHRAAQAGLPGLQGGGCDPGGRPMWPATSD